MESIAVSNPKTSYKVGDQFVKPTVTATYSDQSTKDVTSSATFSGYDLTKAGTYTVTVTYAEGGVTKTTSYSITVSAGSQGGDPNLHLIVMEDFGSTSFTTGAYSVTAAQGEAANAPTYNTNGKDLRVYAKGTLTISNSKAKITKIVFNISTQGLKRLAPIIASTGVIATQASGDDTVTWTGSASEVVFTVGDTADYGTDGSEKPGQFDFVSIGVAPWNDGDVTAKTLESIEVSGQKTNFFVNDEFVFGGKVMAKYSDGSQKDVTEEATVSTPDMTTAGEKTVTVSYSESGDSKSTEYTITVTAKNDNALVFQFKDKTSNGLDSWPASKDDSAEGSYSYALGGANYSFTTTKVGNGIYMSTSYLMICSGNYLGLPVISGKKLVSVSATLNDGGNPSTASQGSITSDTEGTVVSGGDVQTFDSKGVTKTFNLTGTTAGTRYYLAISNKNFQCISLELVYE